MLADRSLAMLQAYAAYNAQDVEALLARVSDDVGWPDGGSRLHGKEEVQGLLDRAVDPNAHGRRRLPHEGELWDYVVLSPADADAVRRSREIDELARRRAVRRLGSQDVARATDLVDPAEVMFGVPQVTRPRRRPS